MTNAMFLLYALPVKVALGLASIAFNPFSMAYVLFTCGVLVFMRVNTPARKAIPAILGVGAVGLWLTHYLSKIALRFPNGTESVTDPVESAGFPLLAFFYPNSAMGGDVPPIEQWPPFFLNYGFWLAVSFLVTPRLVREFRKPETAVRALAIAGFVASLYGLGDTLLRFD